MLYRKYLAFLLVMFCGVHVFAQETINKDVRVVREYTPTVSDAYKINQMPELDDTISFSNEFSYRIISKTVDTGYEPEKISPAKIVDQKSVMPSNSYVKAGLGNYTTGLAEVGYNISESEDYLLGLKASHLSSFGKVTLEDDSEVKAPIHETDADLTFKRFYKNNTLGGSMGFRRDSYRYYGLSTIDAEKTYLISETDELSTDVLTDNEKQRLSVFDMSLTYGNSDEKRSSTLYNFGIGYSAFGNYSGVGQHTFLGSLDLIHPSEVLTFELGLDLQSYMKSVPDSAGTMFSYRERKTTLIKVNPSVHFGIDDIEFKVGVCMASINDFNENNFFIAPDILMNLNIVEGIISLYAGLDGDVNVYDMKRMSYENPFVSPDAAVKPSLYGLNLKGGLEGNFSATTSFSLGASYAFFNDEHFYVNKYYSTITTNPEENTELNYTNLFEPLHDDGTVLTVSGELMVRPKEGIEVVLAGQYYGWSLDSMQTAWHKPEYSIGAAGRFKLSEVLNVNANIGYVGQRTAFDANADGFKKKLDGVFDLSIGAEYIYTKRLIFWATIDNLTASKYHKWNGYPMQRLNAKLGLIYSF